MEKVTLEEAWERVKQSAENADGDASVYEIGDIEIVDKALKEHEQYKTIEKELGVDLVTLVKALKDGVFVIHYDGEIVFEEPMLGFNQERDTDLYLLEGVCHHPPKELCSRYNYYLKDYGKTWALTREELL